MNMHEEYSASLDSDAEMLRQIESFVSRVRAGDIQAFAYVAIDREGIETCHSALDTEEIGGISRGLAKIIEHLAEEDEKPTRLN